jgi:hypothetical protein
MPAGIAAGDILIMTIWLFFDAKSGTLPSAPSGWTNRGSATNSSGDGYGYYVYTKTAGSSESSVTQTGTNWFSGSMTIAAISGGSAVDVVGTVASGPGTNLVASSVTTTATNDVLIGSWAAAKTITARAITAPATMTSQVTTSVTNTWALTTNIATQTLTSAGATGTRTATIPATADYAFFVLLAVK